MKNILIFETEAFDLTEPKAEADGRERPMGRDVAEFFWKKLREKGLEPTSIDEDVASWTFGVTYLRSTYVFYIQFMTLGKPLKDCWVIEIRKYIGFFGMFFSKVDNSDECGPLIEVFNEISSKIPGLSDLKWVDGKQYADYLK
ncbi:MAG: hypothetical protein ACAI35_26215 [Candidatus Methylacidiphilales bacterium]|nr:hypothetical protein [Candidatus Methylacidiphilales bacterium]